VTVTVNALPNAPTANNVTKCYDRKEYTASATATSTNEEIVWYTATSGGSTTTAPSRSATGTTTAYAAARNKTTKCESATRTTVTVTINTLPDAPTANNVTKCYDGKEYTASATVATSQTVVWYAEATGTNTSSAPKRTEAGTTTAYAAAKITVTGCESASRTKVTVTIHAEFKSGKIGSDQTICYGQTPSKLTSGEAASGGKGNYTYSWQYSTDNGNNWHYISNTNTLEYTPTNALTQRTQYRRMVTDDCGTEFTTPVTVTVRSYSLHNYPDLRIRACPTVGESINLSKYIDTLDVTGIQWSPPINSDGSIAASHIASSSVRTFTYTVANPCLSAPVTRKIYLERLKGRMRPLKDTIEICAETAEAVQINQIFGIDAGEGTWTYKSFTAGDVNNYVTISQSPEYRGAVIMNGKALHESAIGYYPYRDMTDAKKVEFTYTPKDGCLKGQTYKIVIILIKT
jgi:hypothetical protein